MGPHGLAWPRQGLYTQLARLPSGTLLAASPGSFGAITRTGLEELFLLPRRPPSLPTERRRKAVGLEKEKKTPRVLFKYPQCLRQGGPLGAVKRDTIPTA